jgi:hypothetical protein
MTLQPLQLKSILFLVVAVAIGPVVASWAFLRESSPSPSTAVLWAIVAVAAITGVVLGGSLRRRSLTIGKDEITLKTTFYARTVKLVNITGVEKIRPGSAEDVIGMRINGLGLPGFQSGWFNAKSGGRVFVDRTAGDYLLISAGKQPKLAMGVRDATETMALLQQHLAGEPCCATPPASTARTG